MDLLKHPRSLHPLLFAALPLLALGLASLQTEAVTPVAAWQTAPGWLKLPPALEQMGNAHGDVAVASNGDVFVSLTGGLRAGVQVYDAEGNYLRNLPDAPRDFHGFVIHQEEGGEFLYGPRLGGQEILKTTLDGKVVLSIPGSAVPQKYWKVNPKTNQPALRLTGCDVAPNGDIFATDGYSTDYVHRFNSKGEYQNTFGGKEAPYSFNTLHKLAIDTRFEPARIVGTDRGNNRVVHLSLEGEFLGDIATDLLMPAAVVVQGDLLAIGEIKGRVTVLDRDNQVVAQLGANEVEEETGTNKTEPARWREGVVNAPHGVDFDADGNLFVTEYSQFGRVLKDDRMR